MSSMSVRMELVPADELAASPAKEAITAAPCVVVGVTIRSELVVQSANF